ncbi:MAG: UDP-N-acetylmuramate dehydrogenase [Rhizobiales bacterium]|nr:UDP-N-acetylmuramate dehydrogenase [Hyphomicrobiales bacterium]
MADLVERIRADVPGLRGRLVAGASIADMTWFRVGGPVEALFTPADEADLAALLAGLDPATPVTVIGLSSNLLIRDGGVSGVVVRLARGFSDVAIEPASRLRAGAAVPDVKVARAAAEAGIAGLSFYRGIPGSIGGAIRMNAGAHGSETKDVLVEARAVGRDGRIVTLSNADLGYTYRHCAAPEELIFTEALFAGRPGDPAEIEAANEEVAAYREEHQPTRERTGGSTFKNPPGESAWKLIDAAGCRGLVIGGAMVSQKHCNFLINTGGASAEDIERLGETVRARVLAASGITLEWEIKRIGNALPGHATGEALAG